MKIETMKKQSKKLKKVFCGNCESVNTVYYMKVLRKYFYECWKCGYYHSMKKDQYFNMCDLYKEYLEGKQNNLDEYFNMFKVKDESKNSIK